MVNYKIKFDIGIDTNFDGHCDLCGRFVDNYGHHRAIQVFDYKDEPCDLVYDKMDRKIDKLCIDDLMCDYYVKNPYSDYTNISSFPRSLILNYTRDDVNNPYGGKNLNSFLCFYIVPKNIDPISLLTNAFQMNIEIGHFVLKNTLVTYRGLSFSSFNDYIQMLDAAYNSINQGKIYKFFEKGFTSTTLDISYAKALSESQSSKYRVLFAYVNLPGSKAMPLSSEFGTTTNDLEKEMLLKFGKDFTIASMQRYRRKGITYYRGIIINSEEDLK